MSDKLRSRRGYTLTELLIVVAIIAIICAIGIGGILSQIKSIRQMKLDRTAQTMYTAAQNRLTELYSSGDTARFAADDVAKRDAKPSDWDSANDYISKQTLTIISSDDSDELKELIFPSNSISEDLYNHNWVVEFNSDQGYVYSVFYSERDEEPVSRFYDETTATKGDQTQAADSFNTDNIRSDKRSVRLKETDARVGYFMGAFNVTERDNVDKPKLTILVENNAAAIAGSSVTRQGTETGDELKLTFRTELPETAENDAKVDYLITITGKTSGSTYTYKLNGLNIVRNSKSEKHIILDKLITDDTVGDTTKNLSFYENFCNSHDPADAQTTEDGTYRLKFSSRDGNMIPGENLEITFTVSSSSDSAQKLKEASTSITVNSLFGNDSVVDEEGSVNEAAISCARHLQNLDPKTSHIGETISGTKNGSAALTSLIFEDAKQLANIDFSDTTGYQQYYKGRDFTPIVNTALKSYDGGEYSIKKLTVGCRPGDDKTERINAGLFGTFYGNTLTNITITGLKANDDNGITIRNAGAIAAELAASGSGSSDDAVTDTSKTVTITNCKVYLQRSDYTGSNEHKDKDKYSFIKANDNAGGLIGLARVGVSIDKSFAATTVEAGEYGSAVSDTEAAAEPLDSYYGKGAGGLIGWTYCNVDIRSSYADCYLTGAYIGGLVGFIKDEGGLGSSISASYSAGFANISEQTAWSAGFAGNKSTAKVAMTASYSAFDSGNTADVDDSASGTSNTKLYSTIVSLASGTATPDTVYYLNTGITRSNIADTVIASSEELKADTGTTITGTGTSGSSGGSTATIKAPVDVLNAKLKTLGVNESELSFANDDTADKATEAYGLRDSGLRTKRYEYPHLLISGKPLMHYCDWLDKDVKSGVLVYFEKYADGKWGFYGETDTLYDSGSITEANHVVTDGYAVLYSQSDYDALGANKDTAVSVSYNNGDITATLNSSTAVSVASANIAKPTDTWSLDTVLLLLPDKITNNGLDGAVGTKAYSGFYQRLDVTNSGITDSYDFAPHFAKARVKTSSSEAVSKPEDDADIYIRTPRQLYLMSEFYGTYQQDTKNCIFYQELDIDYNQYDWGGDSHASYTSLSSMSAADRSQTPIGDGSSEEERFIAEYNGFYHTITGFSILEAVGKHCVGLFGAVYDGGKLQNIVIAAEYKNYKYTAEAKEPVTKNSERAYIGLLAGYVGTDCTVYNCAAASYTMTGYAYGSANIYAGGLVGYNLGSISNCSAVIPSIKIHTNANSSAYVGSFAGYNGSQGEIKNCYGLSYIDANASDKGGTYNLGGFAGTNNGMIESSYCAMAYTSSNVDAGNVSAFTHGVGNVDKCMYLNGGNYYYVDDVHLYSFEDDNNDKTTSASGTQLKGMIETDGDTTYDLGTWLSSDFGKADESIAHQLTTDKSGGEKNYPYPAVVSNGSTNDSVKVHYGEWFFEFGFANFGFVYWEHETGGSNNGYHFYIIDADGAEHSTLCEAHDDGGTVKEYGYGYYYRKDSDVPTPTWEHVNLASANANYEDAKTDSKEVTEAKKNLEKSFNGVYTFVIYRTTETGADKQVSANVSRASDYGMYIIDESAYASCTLTAGTGTDAKTCKYLFTPFFAKSMVLTGTYTPTETSGEKTVSEDDAKTKILGHDTGYEKDASGNDGKSLTYDKKLEDGFPFEIRSISQLQNLNWRWDNKNATSEVTEADATTTTTTTTTLSETHSTETINRTTTYGENATSRRDYEHSSTGDYRYITVAETSSETVLNTRTEGIYTIVTKETKVVKEHKETLTCTYSSGFLRWHGKDCSATATGTAEVVTSITETRTRSGVVNNYTYLKWFAYGDSTYGGSVSDSDGHNYYWKQTHDVSAHSNSFTSIGGLVDTAKTVDWKDPVSKSYIAYFNGDYNGCSYKIQNVNINTTSQTVGLIGSAVCTNLRNIILYSNDNNIIQTDAAGYNWYCLGGLVGWAAQGNIYNCAVAGYTIQDNRVYSGAGDADVGGLAGFCATNITNCSSVNNIVISRDYGEALGYNHSGIVFVGGMAGICPGSITNSYCGGNISSTATNSNVKIYIGGFIGGEWFRASGLQGLTKYLDLERILSTSGCKLPNPTISNCYSYVKLPTVKTNSIESVAPLASYGNINGGSAALGVPITVKNCYYYASYAGSAINIESTSTKHGEDGPYYTNFNYQDAYGNTISNANLSSVMGLSYDTMKSRSASGEAVSGSLLTKLNTNNTAAFGLVTITENGGAAINGKYSFPGSDTELSGENYPFPTIITQSNPFYDEDTVTSESKTVNVHYGEWPKSNGLFIDKSTANIDLITSDTGKTEVNVKYYKDGSAVSMTAEPGISYSTSGIVSSSCTANTDGNGIRYYTVTLQALKEGFETVTLSYTVGGVTYENTIDIAVTADLTVEIEAVSSTSSEVYVGKTVQYKLLAKDANGNTISGLTASNWDATLDTASASKISCTIADTSDGTVLTVKGIDEGTAYISVCTKNIYPKYDTGKTGTPIGNKYRTQTIAVKSNPDESTTSLAAMLYTDGERLDSSTDNPVSVAYSASASDDSTASQNLAYWTNIVANDAAISLGRSFTGWVTEDGEAFTAETKLKSNVRVSASWQTLSISFMDKAEGAADYSKIKTLSYYGGNLYTDDTMSTSATAPTPYQRSGSDVFSGYWTEPDGGELVYDSDGILVTSLADSGSISLYARFNVSADELAALADAKSEAAKAQTAALAAELKDLADAEALANAAGADTSAADIEGATTAIDGTAAAASSETETTDSSSSGSGSSVAVDSNGNPVDLNETSAVIGYTGVD